MPKIPLHHLPPSPPPIMDGGGPPHRRFELGPEIIGLLGVFAGVIVVATYQCLVNNCCCSQRHIQNANTQQQQQQNEQQRQGIQINPNIHRPPTSNNPPPAHLIPTFKYTKECKEGICAVCLCEFRDGETIRVLPECMHLFHAGCIDMWLNSHSNCPLCRTDIVPPRHVVLSMPPPQHVVLSMPHFSGGDI